MTSTENSSASAVPLITPDTLPPAFTREVTKARAAIFWERLWPRVVPPASITALFCAASFAGVWGMTSPVGRIAGVAAFALALVASPFRYKTGSLLSVTRKDALKRLDRNLNDPVVDPAQIIGGRVAEGSTDADREAWNRNITGVWQRYAGKFEAGWPHPGMNKRDPLRLRWAIAATLLATAALSQQPHMEQIKQAFDWSTPLPPTPPVPPAPPMPLKAWITLPEGINDIPPLEMNETTRDDSQGGEKMVAHQSSVLTIVTYGTGASVRVNGEVLALKKELPQGEGKTGYQYEAELKPGKAIVEIDRGPRWQITVREDKPPVVTLDAITQAPGKDSKSLLVTGDVKDDFGATGQIVIVPPGNQDPKAEPLPSAVTPVFTIN